MSRHPQFSSSPDEVLALRQQAGRWLKSLREAEGLSQRAFAKAVGIEFYTFISQIESGRGRVPPAQYIAFSEALNVPLKEFVSTLLRFYDPVTHYALFGLQIPEKVAADLTSQNDNASTLVSDLAKRIARLETMLAEQTAK